jgi:hypothetical protein
MNGGTCLRETPGKRVPRGRKKNVRCNRSSLLTNSLPYKERQVEAPKRVAQAALLVALSPVHMPDHPLMDASEELATGLDDHCQSTETAFSFLKDLSNTKRVACGIAFL